MRQHLVTRTSATALLVAMLVAAHGGASMGEDIGVTAATNPVAIGAPPGQAVRELRIGLNIIRNERIRTTEAGSTQIIFLDRTSLTIGPNSDITIDQYVYNPDAGSGNLAVRMGRGVLRLIGGEISHSDQIRITTPTATLGIRGGMALVDSTQNRTSVVHLYGTTIVTTAFSSVTLVRPGSYVYTTGSGISDPISVPPELLARLNARLGSKRGQTGGADPGQVTSATLRQIVSNAGPSVPDRFSQGLSPEQLQFIVSIRPQLQSISPITHQKCDIDHRDDCRTDRHHHHRHRWERFPEHREENFAGERWEHPSDEHGLIRGSLHPFGLSGPGLPEHPGPCLGSCGQGLGNLGVGRHP
jgi:hypothetical protein